MKRYGPLTWFTIVIATFTVLAWGCSASTANISSAKLARDEAGNDTTTSFASGDTFYCIVDLANAPDDTVVKASWIAVEAEGAEPNMAIDSASKTTGSGTITFNLTNSNPWPPGKYKVELYLNDKLDRSLDFEVQS